MLQRYVDQIKEADMVLIGIGRELSAKKLIPMDSDEVRKYYKENYTVLFLNVDGGITLICL